LPVVGEADKMVVCLKVTIAGQIAPSHSL